MTEETKDKELKAMEEDVKKAMGKDNEDLVAKTIADTRERLAKEQENDELKAKVEELEKSKEEVEIKRKEEMEALEARLKEEQEKLVQEFKDSRQSTVNSNNPFNSQESGSEKEATLLQKYKNDPEFERKLNEESQKAFEDKMGMKLFR